MQRKPATTARWLGRLPHWEVEGGRYFITVHLSGAIPQAGKNEIRATAQQLRRIRDPQSPAWLRRYRRIFLEMEAWLDRADHKAWLKEEAIAKMVMQSIAYYQAQGDWRMFEFVVMPSHLHLFCEIGQRGLKKTMQGFKRWTGHRAVTLLDTKPTRFWQREWFDHWSRSDSEDDRIIAYIRKNPVQAGLVKQYTDWPFASWSTSLPPEGTLG